MSESGTKIGNSARLPRAESTNDVSAAINRLSAVYSRKKPTTRNFQLFAHISHARIFETIPLRNKGFGSICESDPGHGLKYADLSNISQNVHNVSVPFQARDIILGISEERRSIAFQSFMLDATQFHAGYSRC